MVFLGEPQVEPVVVDASPRRPIEVDRTNQSARGQWVAFLVATFTSGGGPRW
jgi:hypothetical protein